MNYYIANTGYIGDYRGYKVYSVELKDFTKADTLNNPDIIFAVKNKHFSFLLVRDGYLIGDMKATGEIALYTKREKWVFKEEAKVSNEVKGYSVYSKTVDDFFAGLNDWWKDLEK